MTKNIIFNIRHWSQLTEEQLVTVKDMQCREYDAPILLKQDIFLYLAGLRIAEDGASVLNEYMERINEGDGTAVYDGIDKLYGFLTGDIVVLENVSDDSERYILSLDQLRAAIVACTEWISEDHSLISLPMENIVLGNNEYKLPETLLCNLTYQQYTNAQHYLEAYWHIIDQVEKMLEGEHMKQETNADYSPSRETADAFNDLNAQAEDYQRCFLASMLTPYHNEGEQRYDADGKPFTFIRKVARFNINDEELAKADMKSAPQWLFPLVYQQLQDNLRQFHRKFPDLFSEHTGGGRHDAFIAELGTINVIIEKGGYPNAEAVFDENAVFIFKRLDMLQEEAREMKSAMEKNKIKK